MDEARSVRDFWFGRAALTTAALKHRMLFWFGGADSELGRRRDQHIRVRFGELLERAADGQLSGWADGPRRRLSLIIVLDQFPRNMFRGDARAFAHDAQALQLALSGLQSAADAALDLFERMFFYMPMQHAENREVQDESVAAYRRLRAEAPEEVRDFFGSALRSAQHHRSIIERFGRFPHRNRILGRTDTREEEQWLQKSSERFGQ